MTTFTKGEAQKKFNELRHCAGRVDPQELDEAWAALDPVHVDEIVGEWKGSGFDTGHSGSAALKQIRWYGKRFNSRLEVQPVICTDDDGNLYANTAASNGEASLWMVEFRGEVTATMVYDGLPIFDHFKRVDETTLFGIMNGKGELVFDNGQHFYFILEKA
jgi:Domain of unknown function (DUF4334)/GXWXG protein